METDTEASSISGISSSAHVSTLIASPLSDPEQLSEVISQEGLPDLPGTPSDVLFGPRLSPPPALSHSIDVELPAGSDDEDREHEGAETGLVQCKCRRNCPALFQMESDQSALIEFRQNVVSMDASVRNAFIFNTIRDQVVDESGNLKKRVQWRFMSRDVCLAFWVHAVCTSRETVVKTKKLLKSGHQTSLARSGTRLPSARDCAQLLKADAWFLQVYTDFAEPLAKEDQSYDENDEHDTCLESAICADHPLWALAAGADGDRRFVPNKWLPPMSFADIVFMHEVTCTDNVSGSTLQRAWDTSWKGILKIRNAGQHGRCQRCAELTAARQAAIDDETKARVREEHAAHVNAVMADRAVSNRASAMSEHAARHLPHDGNNQIIKLTIDGMDQAKFKCPRNLASSKGWEKLWRPQLHVVGVTAHGHIEAYYIMDADMKKDSNMECSLIAHTLDLVQNELRKKGGAMPQNLVVAADNTA